MVFNSGDNHQFLMPVNFLSTKPTRGLGTKLPPTQTADGLRLCQGFVTLYNQPRSQDSLLPVPAQRENSGNELDWRYKALRTSALKAVRNFSIIDLPNHHQTKVNTNP